MSDPTDNWRFERRVILIEKYRDHHGVPQYAVRGKPYDIATALSVLCDAITGDQVTGWPADLLAGAREFGNIVARYHARRS